jgi:hypothetical protein
MSTWRLEKENRELRAQLAGQQTGGSATGSGQACMRCNGFGHRQEVCPKRHVTCRACNKVGHLDVACRSVRPKSSSHSSSQNVKPALKCSWCNRHNHVVGNCEKKKAYDAAKASVPLAPSAKQIPVWGRAMAAGEGKPPWKCSTIACEAWYPDTVNRCLCGKPRLRDKEEKKVKGEHEYLPCTKQSQEILGRLCAQDDGDDANMNLDYQLPLDQVELVQEREKLMMHLKTCTSNDVPKEAIDAIKLKLSKLPLPSSNQPAQDWACLAAQQLKSKKEYQKQAAICEKRKDALVQEKEDRDQELSRELELANLDHEARVAAIRSQHAIHMADTLAREEANLAKAATLEAQNEKLMEELSNAIEASKKEGKESAGTQAPVMRPQPPALVQAPALPAFTGEMIMNQMGAANSGLIPEQAAAFAIMINNMISAAMAPTVVNASVITPAVIVPDPVPPVPQEPSDEAELTAELATLNGGFKPGFTARVSNRVSPLGS